MAGQTVRESPATRVSGTRRLRTDPAQADLRNLEDLEPGDHLCCLYSTEEEHRAVLMPFLLRGLELSQKVTYIADSHRREEILQYLEGRGFDLSGLLSSRQLSIVTPAETYLRDGVFDPDRMIAFLRAETDRAIAEGYPALRVTGEMTWALSGAPGSSRLIEYEAKLNDFFPGSKCLALCQYDMRRFNPDSLLDILRTHPIAVAGTTPYDNFYYIPPEEFLGPDVQSSQLRNWLANLSSRRQLEESLRSARDDWALTFNSLSDAISIHDTSHNLLYCNEAFQRLFPHAVPGQTKCYAAVHGTTAPPAECPLAKVLQTGMSQPLEFFEPTVHRDFHLRADPVFDSGGRVTRVVHVLNDVTVLKQTHRELQKAHDELEQRVKQRTAQLKSVVEALQVEIHQRAAAEERLTRVNRALRALSEANQILVRASSEPELLHRICDVLVQVAGYRMAWIGFPEHDARKSVRPVAQAGFDDDYLKSAEISWADTERGRGPTGTAIRTRHVQVVQDVHHDPSFRPWREQAIRRGYNSSAAFPLVVQGELLGALSIYATESDAFDPEEVKLLTELSADLAFGIHSLRTRVARQRAEEARDRLAAILEATTDFVGTASPEGYILSLNRGARRLVGIPDEEDVTHLRIADLHPDSTNLVLLQEAIPAAVRDGIWEGETAVLGRNGREIPVSQVILAHRTDGKVEYFSTIIRDLTERKRTERALQASEARVCEQLAELEHVYGTAPVGLALFDHDLRYLRINEQLAAMDGRSPAEHIGRTMGEVIPEVAEEVEPLLRNILATGEPVVGIEIATMAPQTGQPRVALVSYYPLKDEEGSVRAINAVVLDVSERQMMQKQIGQLQKFEAIGKLAGGIAHDFNNVIAAILGWAEMGSEESPAESRLRAHFQKIAKQAERAAGLTRQLLAFARRQVLQPSNLSLNQAVNEVTSLLQKVIGEHIELRLRLAPDLAITCADPAQLEQVLMNLCLNARDAMPDGGQLTIETANAAFDEEYCRHNLFARPGRYVELAVSDTGRGMTPDVLEHIFEPFYSTKEPGQGTGLGLATVYGVVQQHEGLIHVYSEPGQGTTFRVYLPAVSAVVELEEKPRAEPAPRLRGTETILIAEDHEGIREMALETLSRLGYSVLLATDGEEALRIFEAHKEEIALVLLDVVLPKISGPQAYARMSALRPKLPVIFATGYGSELDLLSPLESACRGQTTVLQKPYSPSMLAQRIRETLDRPNVSEF